MTCDNIIPVNKSRQYTRSNYVFFLCDLPYRYFDNYEISHTNLPGMQRTKVMFTKDYKNKYFIQKSNPKDTIKLACHQPFALHEYSMNNL